MLLNLIGFPQVKLRQTQRHTHTQRVEVWQERITPTNRTNLQAACRSSTCTQRSWQFYVIWKTHVPYVFESIHIECQVGLRAPVVMWGVNSGAKTCCHPVTISILGLQVVWRTFQTCMIIFPSGSGRCKYVYTHTHVYTICTYMRHACMNLCMHSTEQHT